jgi:hypothetical protein
MLNQPKILVATPRGHKEHERVTGRVPVSEQQPIVRQMSGDSQIRSALLKWSLCNQQHHEIRIQGIANYYVIVYVTEAKNDADVGVSMCI